MEDRAKKTSRINTWKPNSKQVYVEQDGKIFVCHFDKIFQQPKLEKFNKFYIKKGSYENQLDIITKYTNFFINNYDTDNELVTAYLKIKQCVDDYKMFDTENMDAYISFIYEIMFSDTLIQKILQLVNENYLDDIEVDLEEKRKKYQKNEKKHLESLEFTNQHIKILLAISFSMKIMCPAMLHYHAINTMKIEKDSDNIFKFYKPLFDIFSIVKQHDDMAYVKNDGEGYFYIKNKNTGFFDKYDVDGNLVLSNIMEKKIDTLCNDGLILIEPRDYNANYNLYNKLFVYVKAKVNESYSNNSPIFEQQEIFGVDLYSVVHSFVRRVLISENIVKYKFNEVWDQKQKKYKENIIGFNKTIIKYQLIYFLKEQYGKNLTEITNSKNTDGLSGSDKMAMNLSKIDEGITTIAMLNVPLTIEYLKRRYDTEVTEEEIDFYIKNHHPDMLQILLVRSFFAKYFGSYRDLFIANRRAYMTLLIILKKKLMTELGYDSDTENICHDEPVYVPEISKMGDDEDDAEYSVEDEFKIIEDGMRPVALPYIISGNIGDKIHTRVIRNIKFTDKVEKSYTFKKLQEENHKYLNYIKPDYDMQLMSSLINTKFTYCESDRPDLLDTEITYSDNKISDEILFFLNTI